MAFFLGIGIGSVRGRGGREPERIFGVSQTTLPESGHDCVCFLHPEPDLDFWSMMGQHHPVWFRDAKCRSPSRWYYVTIQTTSLPAEKGGLSHSAEHNR